MRVLIVAIVVVGCFGASVSAQEAPPPAAELAKFKPLLGHWSGSGTASFAPGAPEMKWTSTSTMQWILGGHFLQDDVKVTFAGEGAPPPMVFRSFYGWDRNHGKYVSYSVGNSGEMEKATHVAWIDKTLVKFSEMVEGGVPSITRAMTTLSEHGSDFQIQIASGLGDFGTLVSGTLKKSETGYTISGDDLKHGAPASEEMKKIAGMCGSYTMSGEMSPKGMPAPMQISASETVAPIFGGSIIDMRVKGDPLGGPDGFQYEAIVLLAWNPKSGCYDQVYFNNVGDANSAELRWSSDKVLASWESGLQYGEPVATQASIHLDDSGAIVKAVVHRLDEGGVAVKAFSGSYKKSGS